MKRSILSRVLVLVCACGALVACGPPEKTTEAQAPPKAKVPLLHEFLPLKDKTVSSFELSTDLGDEGILVLEIFRPRPDLAELKIAGRVQRLTVEDNRISQATGGILLETPLEKGHSFQGSFGRVVIQEVNQLVEVPAGTFAACLTTVEESVKPPKRATTTFCPGIGMVQMKVESFAADGVGMVETRLTQHGPRVEIPQKHSGRGSTPR
jgi:hypothetical protein